MIGRTLPAATGLSASTRSERLLWVLPLIEHCLNSGVVRSWITSGPSVTPMVTSRPSGRRSDTTSETWAAEVEVASTMSAPPASAGRAPGVEPTTIASSAPSCLAKAALSGPDGRWSGEGVGVRR